MEIRSIGSKDGKLGGDSQIFGRFEYDDGFSEEVWFESLAGVDKDGFDPSGDAFLTAALPVAMRLGEDIRIDYPVSESLLRNLDELQGIFNCWYKNLRRVVIQAVNIEGDKQRPEGRAAFFSGGIDSSFTALYEREKIDSLVTVWGYDIPLAKVREFSLHRERLQRMADFMGKNLVAVATNLRDTRYNIADWGPVGCGPALAGVGHLLGASFGTFYVGSDHSYKYLLPWGAHPLTTPLLSSAIRFVNHGSEFSRVEKTEFVSKYDYILDDMHVCWVNEDHTNCCKCNKCLRVMGTLDAVGARGKGKAFDWDKYDHRKLASVYHSDESSKSFYHELLEYCGDNGNEVLLRVVQKSLDYSEKYERVKFLFDFLRQHVSYKLGEGVERIFFPGMIR